MQEYKNRIKELLNQYDKLSFEYYQNEHSYKGKIYYLTKQAKQLREKIKNIKKGCYHIYHQYEKENNLIYINSEWITNVKFHVDYTNEEELRINTLNYILNNFGGVQEVKSDFGFKLFKVITAQKEYYYEIHASRTNWVGAYIQPHNAFSGVNWAYRDVWQEIQKFVKDEK